ncbi:MAG: cytochrome C [candidate division KSB1 bacterium]|nr:cytochrome C [candidate division KSB1 bacterium]
MRRQLIIFLLVNLGSAGYIFIKAEEDQVRSKIIKFSHRIHVKEAEMACTDCHGNIEQSTKAEDRNLPSKSVCSNCHDVQDTSTCTLCHVTLEKLESFANPVRRFYFNHKIHVTEEKLGCERCHPGMEDVDLGEGKKIPPRENCNACHNGLAASMACLVCHSGDTRFRPDSHIPTWSREHRVQIRAGETNCAHCHTNNYCQECHEATDLISTRILPVDFYTPFSPQASGDQTLVLKAVHDLNYRYVHQLDASGKEKDCRTCHEMSSYCAECHTSAGINAQLRPAWHDGADWGALALGVGSGGGRHAELARRDLERCAACHDVQGADPTCLLCHTDFDGIKHTDPKTHESGFSNRFGRDSNFHNDTGAICFTCHTNTQQRGQGFCGYCHNSER